MGCYMIDSWPISAKTFLYFSMVLLSCWNDVFFFSFPMASPTLPQLCCFFSMVLHWIWYGALVIFDLFGFVNGCAMIWNTEHT